MHKIIRLAVVMIICGLTMINLSVSQTMDDPVKKEALRTIDQKAQLLIDVSDKIWEYAEIALMEYQSSELLEEVLEKEGFRVEKDVADLPTAFVATFGSGNPVIGILAEYDALPGLSQDSTPFKKVLEEEGNGQGCGHNLFGAGSLGAALALKQVMEKHAIQGTLKLYGCPAEEDVGGKLYMARAGLFDDLDACLAWHPDYETSVDVDSGQAVDDLRVEFFGKTAHAAFDPWMGNSALDAAETMTFGVNLLREHVKPSVRIHYVITDGGKVPNIVPEYAKVWIWVRDLDRDGVKAVVERVEKIVEGAAIATGTTHKIHYEGSYHEMLINRKGSEIMQKNLEKIGPITYTEEEILYAQKIQKEAGIDEKGMVVNIEKLKEPEKYPEGGSTDVAEVSWITPTIHLSITCAPHGIPWHSWAVVASSKHPIGYKGMFLAAKVMAATALDLLRSPDVLEEMKKEFDEKRKGYTYKSGISPDQKPPVRIKRKS
ncbi:MAG: amidohydrolase [Candidatus Aminicenantes bacterium]|nr:MAG: amidohydrolase [Candidatus Aminicenantes bacterium]